MHIQLKQPIPEEGRIPTRTECQQFHKRGILATRSGAWRISWYDDDSGKRKPCISYFDKRSRDGAG